MTTLTIALPLVRPAVGTEFRYVLGAGDGVSHGQGTAALDLLPRADSVVLVVPAQCLSWHVAKLPPMAAGRQRAALEGILEDRLLDEPATLALALAPRRKPDGNVVIAACDKAWLAAVLQFFEQGGRPASRVVPELAPLEEGAGELLLLASGTEDDARIVMADHNAVVSMSLGMARSVLPGDFAALANVDVMAEPMVSDQAERLSGHAVVIRPAALALLASGVSQWELAQFDLAISSRGRLARRGRLAWSQLRHAPAWRAARWGAAALVLVNLAGLNAWAWHLDQVLAARRAQVKQVLTQTFPKVKTVVDAPLQMEREVALLRQASGALSPRDLETMLSALGGALSEGPTAKGMDFSAGQLGIKGLGIGPAQVEMVSGKLTGQGYSVRLEGERLTVRTGGRP